MSTVTQIADRDGAAQIADAEAGANTQLAAVKPYPGGRDVALVPRNLEEAAKFAQLLAASDMVPKDYKGKPANVLTSILFGQDVGLPPMQALQSIANINGRPSLWGDGLLAVVMNHPAYRDHEETYLVDGVEKDSLLITDLAKDTVEAVCRFWRKGRSKPFVGTFSIGQAKKAGLWSKEGPWTNYPARMLKFRARGFAARDAFPDALRGLCSAEEALDIPTDDYKVEKAEPIPMPQRITSSPVVQQKPLTPTSTSEAAGGKEVASWAEPVSAGAVSTPAPAAQALPDGHDRIKQLRVSPRTKGGEWADAMTERGVHVFTLEQSVVDTLKNADARKALIVLALNEQAEPQGYRIKTVTLVEA